MTALGLIISLGSVFAVLAWVGWRYFVAPLGLGATASLAAAAPAGELPRASRTVAAPAEKLARSVRSKAFLHWPVWLALLPAGVAITGVLALSGEIALDPLQAIELGRLKHIQSALNPEALVPPPPLPPSVFTGTDRPGLETADRDWTKLNPGFAKLALLVFARAEARGYPLALLEGYRSPERQDALAESPVHVTNARAFQSKHQYGQALDAAPIRDGRLVISERDPWAMEAYRVLGEEAEKAGLIWGGRWKLKDFGHIEAPDSIAAIARQK